MYNFETFTNVGSSYTSKISIRKNGTIGFSQGSLIKFGLNTGKWFGILKYDRSAKVIGIKITQNEHEDGAAKIQRRELSGKGNKINLSGQISARAFLDFFGIEYVDRTKSYVPAKDGDLIIIDLNKEKTTGKVKKQKETE